MEKPWKINGHRCRNFEQSCEFPLQNFVEEKVKSRPAVICPLSPPFVLFCADCFPEKAVQILVEAREHGWEILHHGEPSGSCHPPTCSWLGQTRGLESRPWGYWDLMPKLLNYPTDLFLFSFFLFPASTISPFYPWKKRVEGFESETIHFSWALLQL